MDHTPPRQHYFKERMVDTIRCGDGDKISKCSSLSRDLRSLIPVFCSVRPLSSSPVNIVKSIIENLKQTLKSQFIIENRHKKYLNPTRWVKVPERCKKLEDCKSRVNVFFLNCHFTFIWTLFSCLDSLLTVLMSDLNPLYYKLFFNLAVTSLRPPQTQQ